MKKPIPLLKWTKDGAQWVARGGAQREYRIVSPSSFGYAFGLIADGREAAHVHTLKSAKTSAEDRERKKEVKVTFTPGTFKLQSEEEL